MARRLCRLEREIAALRESAHLEVLALALGLSVSALVALGDADRQRREHDFYVHPTRYIA